MLRGFSAAANSSASAATTARAAAGTAAHQWPRGGSAVLPPLEFDRPYAGTLTVVRTDVMPSACPKPDPGKPILGCAVPNGRDWCVVHIALDSTLAAAGISFEIVLRHETGHCNGWPNDHPGARPIEAQS